MNRIDLLIIFLLLFPSIVYSQEPIKIKKTEEKIVLDGKLSESIWKTLSPFDFTEFTPNNGQKDTLTTMFVTYDDTNLYIGFIAKEPTKDAVISRSLLRDKWYGDDYVSFHIDPNDSDEKSFIFSVFPTGSRTDIAVSNDAIPLGNSTFNNSYDMIWESKVHHDEEGWSVEFKIPISNLRFKKSGKDLVAGISGLRSQNHLNKRVTFPELPQNLPNAVERPSLKHAVVFEDLSPTKQLQITPYITGSTINAYNFLDAENRHDKTTSNDFDAGLDIRYGISPDLILDVTVNTDFSQVEIDDQIVNINDRVNIFLPEKRKFFQEQAGLFDFNAGILSQLFYSRNIGINDGQLTPIIGGARLTGNIGKTDIGFLSLQTEGIRISETNLIPTENFSVLRLRRKIVNQKSFIGFMVTNRIRNGYFNTAIGVDNVISFPKDLFLISSVSTSIEKGEENYNAIDNTRLSIFLDKRRQDNWFYKAAYEYSGDNYNPSMGFLLRERHHNFYVGLSHGKFNSDKKKHLFQYNQFRILNSDVYMNTNFTDVITWYNRSFWSGRLFSGDSFSVFAQTQYESLDNALNFDDNLFVSQGNYWFYYFGASYNPAIQHRIQIPFGVEYGTFFDGTNLRFNLNPTINLGKHFNIESSYRLNKITFKERNQNEWLHIGQAKFNWAYNLHLSGSLITQYNSLSNKLFTSARLRYNFRDGHDLYLVYNQDYNTQRNLLTPEPPRYNNQILTLKYLYTFFK